jgi:hypothetical protein
LIRYYFFMVGVYEKGFCVSRVFWPQNMECGIDDDGRIKGIVIDGDLRDVIHDIWGSLPACAVHTDRRIMDFRRRP